MHRTPIALALAATGLLLAATDDAIAATTLRDYVHSAVSVCQGALPSFEGAIRKRPLAIRNEGDIAAFISCGLFANNAATRIYQAGVVTVFNGGVAAQSVSCTLVDGFHGGFFPPASYSTKTVSLAPEATTSIVWTPAADNGGLLFRTMNWSCNLPPGVEIGLVGGYYNEEIGS